MTLFLHELKRGRLSLLIWTAAISFMLGVCIIIYPEMATEMNEISDTFANMGAFSEAFGMDQLNFGEFMGYFGVECGNTLGLGGALFAATLGISMLAKEEKDRTAEFLLSHPISRAQVLRTKLFAMLAQILILNLAVAAVSYGCILIIGEEPDLRALLLLFLANIFLQLELAAITFGLSSLLHSGGFGIGLGLALGFYFINLLANLTEALKFLKYLTPFGYTDGGQIIQNETLEWRYLLVGGLFAAAGIFLAFFHYRKKDIQ